jgi:RND superfamily putative drug exporter
MEGEPNTRVGTVLDGTEMRLAEISIRRAGWVIVACLLAVGAVNVGVPQLEEVIADSSLPFIPENAEANKTFEAMDEAFGNGDSKSFLYVVAERDGGLTDTDRRFVEGLVPKLEDESGVSSVQDVSANRLLFDSLTSKDEEAVYFQLGLYGDTGAPLGNRTIDSVREVVHRDHPSGLDVAVTGYPTTIADMSALTEASMTKIAIASVVMIGIILTVLYRRVAVTGVVLGFIGLSLALARGLTSLAGTWGMDVSTFTAAVLTAVILGAATDYAIFLISRYHEERRNGHDSDVAVGIASSKISVVIAASALTVILANASMVLADVGLFTTTGPAIALGVGATLALSMTLLPALVAVLGRRGLLDPHSATTNGGGSWQRISLMVVSRPGRVLVAGLVPLIVFAAFYPTLTRSFDERVVQPDTTESNRGYEMIADHYPDNEVLSDFVLITADRDMRNTRDLAALEQSAASVARTEGVQSVRSITRPDGTPITEASLARAMGRIGDRLGDAENEIEANEDESQELVEGAGGVSSGAGQVASGADQAVGGTGRLLGGARKLENGLERLSQGSGKAKTGTAELRRGARLLANGLETAHSQTKEAVDGLGMAYKALQASPTCGLDPACKQARDGIGQIYVAQRDQLLPGLREAAAAARQIAAGTGTLRDGLVKLDRGLNKAEKGASDLAAGQKLAQQKLGQLADGAGQVADGSSKVAGGTKEMTASMKELQKGLEEAAGYLQKTSKVAKDPAVGGFYLPPSAFDDPRLAATSGVFLSDDGRHARMVVIGKTDPFGHEGTDRLHHIVRAAEDGLRDTRLADSDVSSTGIASFNNDLENFMLDDFALVAAVTLATVFLILLLMLRGIAISLILMASVVLSYGSAVGLSVLVWQVLLDRPLDWWVPVNAFVLLVAVGADYNMLLMKRIREEAPDGSPLGIARAVSATGRVITAAGLIFAASMFGLMFGSVTSLGQFGFTVGMGLLLDTFIVRTLVVPACATLLGRRLWWPGRRTSTLEDERGFAASDLLPARQN